MLNYIYSKFYISFVLKLLLLFFDCKVPDRGGRRLLEARRDPMDHSRDHFPLLK